MAQGLNKLVRLISGDVVDVNRTNVLDLRVIIPATTSGDLSSNTKDDHCGKWFIILPFYAADRPLIPLIISSWNHVSAAARVYPSLLWANRGNTLAVNQTGNIYSHSCGQFTISQWCFSTVDVAELKPNLPFLGITACITFSTKYKIKGPADVIVQEHIVKMHTQYARYSLAPCQQLIWWFHIRQQILLPPVLWPGSTVGCCWVFNVNNNMWGYFK